MDIEDEKNWQYKLDARHKCVLTCRVCDKIVNQYNSREEHYDCFKEYILSNYQLNDITQKIINDELDDMDDEYMRIYIQQTFNRDIFADIYYETEYEEDLLDY